MDLKVTCKGAEIDGSKPYTGLFNYDGTPSRDIIRNNLVNDIVDYRDDFMDDISALREVHRNSSLTFDGTTGEGSARIDVEGERFEMELHVNPDIPVINPDIPVSASVRVSSDEAVHYGAYGVLVGASPHADTWTVRMLEGGTVNYGRSELADLSSHTSIDGKLGTEIEVPAAYEIGEYVNYITGEEDEGQVVQVMTRRYTSAMSMPPWSYWCRDVETGMTNLHLGERALFKLPRNVQNLTIMQRG